MIRKLLLEIRTVQIPQSSTKILWILFWKTQDCLENQVNLHEASKIPQQIINAKTKNKKVCSKIMRILQWSHWCSKTSLTKKMIDQGRKKYHNLQTNTEDTNQNHWQKKYGKTCAVKCTNLHVETF